MNRLELPLRIWQLIAGFGSLVVGLVALAHGFIPMGGVVFFLLSAWCIFAGIRGVLRLNRSSASR